MKISEHCVTLARQSEGCRLTAYPDPATGGAPWTIGWGNTHPIDGVPAPPEPIVLWPPESVFKPCEVPTLQGDTWGDIGSHALALQTALSLCAGQVATLIQWRETAGRK